MKTFPFLLSLIVGVSAFSQSTPAPTIRVKAIGSVAIKTVVDYGNNAVGDSIYTYFSDGTKKGAKGGTGLDATSPVFTGNTPTVSNNADTNVIANVAMGAGSKNARIILNFTVKPDQVAQGSLCTIAFSGTNAWTSVPISEIIYPANRGLGVLTIVSASATSLALAASNFTPGVYQIIIRNNQ